MTYTDALILTAAKWLIVLYIIKSVLLAGLLLVENILKYQKTFGVLIQAMLEIYRKDKEKLKNE